MEEMLSEIQFAYTPLLPCHCHSGCIVRKVWFLMSHSSGTKYVGVHSKITSACRIKLLRKRKKNPLKSGDAVTDTPLHGSWSLQKSLFGHAVNHLMRAGKILRTCGHMQKPFVSVYGFVFSWWRISSKTRSTGWVSVCSSARLLSAMAVRAGGGLIFQLLGSV